jgi:hypothetical protein
MHMVIILPLLVAVFAVSFQLSSGALKLQFRENRQISIDAGVRELVRRIQRDVGSADSAVVERMNDAVLLELRKAEGSIVYKADSSGVTRIEQLNNDTEKESVWTMQSVGMDFQIEEIASEPRMVWIKFESRLQMDRGPVQVRRISAAATIGRGGTT